MSQEQMLVEMGWSSSWTSSHKKNYFLFKSSFCVPKRNRIPAKRPLDPKCAELPTHLPGDLIYANYRLDTSEHPVGMKLLPVPENELVNHRLVPFECSQEFQITTHILLLIPSWPYIHRHVWIQYQLLFAWLPKVNKSLDAVFESFELA